MSGPVSPPLATTESGTTVRVQPTNTLEFNGADFTVTQSGSKASIAIDSTGTGAALTDTHIGFGSAANLLTGSANFTFTEESGGTGPTMHLTGDKPQITIQDDTDATDYKTKLIQSGASLYHYSADSTGTNNEMVRYAQNYISFQRSMTANVGIGTVPATGVALHIKDAESDNDNVVIRIQDDSADTVGDQIAIEGYYNTVEAGRMFFELRDTGNGASAFVIDAYDGTDLMEFVRMDADAGAVTFNEQSEDIDFRIETNNEDSTLRIVGSTDNVGICTIPNSNTVLHISDDGTKANTVRIESTDNDTSVGPVLDLRRNNADGTATDGDNLGVIQFSGLDDGGGSETYARIRASAADTHSTLAEGAIEFLAAYNNVETEVMRIGPIGDGGAANFGVDVNYNSQSTVDFRVRGDTVDNLLYADVSNNFIGIGRYPSGAERLVVSGTGTTDPTVLIESTSTDLANEGPQLEFYRAANLEDNDKIGVIRFSGQDDAGNKTEYGRIEMMISDESTPGEDGEMIFYLTEAGSIKQEYFRIRGGSRQIEFNTSQDDIDFVINSDTVANFVFMDASQDNMGIGGTPSSTGAQFQVALGAQFYRETSNTFTANHDVTVEQAHGHVLVMDASSGSANTFTLPDVAAIGMHVKLVNLAGSNGMTVAVAGTTSHQINGVGTAGSSSVSTTTKFQTIECHYVATNVWVATEPAVAA